MPTPIANSGSMLLPRGPASLGVVLALTFVNSLGTGAVTNGVFFIARQSQGFDRDQNFLLGALLGLTYTAAALGVGPLLTRMIDRRASASRAALTHRSVLTLVTIVLGLLCFLPWLAIDVLSQTNRAPWAIWVFTLTYSPLTGALWPIIESYLAGGRRGQPLRRAVGRFNLCWASAIPVAYWGMAPFLKNDPLLALNALGVFHLISLGLIWRLSPKPARHLDDTHEPTPPVYRPLLSLCRVLLPTSYLVFSVWTPYQPTALSQLGVAVVWHTPIAATWHIARVAVFLLLERLAGWHGRWWLPIAGAIALVAGLIGSIIAPTLGPGGFGLSVLIAALVLFGSGMGAIYAAALYYAMAVGDAEVDAGGKHEALIGVGYTLGPALGLAVGLTTQTSWFPLEDGFTPTLLGSVVVVCLVIGLWTAWWVPRTSRAHRA